MTTDKHTTQDETRLAVRQTGEPLSTDQPREKVGERWYRPDLDLFEFDDRYEMRVDLPGASRDGIDVNLDGALMTIEAPVPDRTPEGASRVHAGYGVGNFYRRVRLGEDIDAERIEASFGEGVLTLTLPKRAGRRPRRIEISSTE